MNDFGRILRLYAAGDHSQALRRVQAYASCHPDAVEAISLHGLILAANGSTHEALDKFALAVQRQPEQAEHWLNYGNALRECGRLQAAIDALETARAQGGTGVALDLDLGMAYLDAHRLQEACTCLKTAVAGLPPQAAGLARICLAHAYAGIGRSELALHVLAELDFTAVDDADALNRLGIVLNLTGRTEEAERVLYEALRRNPGLTQAAQNLAAIYERSNRLEEAKRLLVRLPASDGTAALPLLRARIAARDRDDSAALAHFREAERLQPDVRLRIDLHFDRGKLHDRLGEPDAAMCDFDAGHAAALTLLQLQHPWLAPDTGMEDWGDAARSETGRPASTAPRCADPFPQDPIFVVGFPRSGTTLLEQLLHAHEDLQSMDEQMAIETAIDEMRGLGYRYPQDLVKLDAVAYRRVRERYWQAVGSAVSLASSTRLVDKYPFNAVRLPFIAHFFPDAKVVMLLRHPADVCLSCYMQKFRLNAGTRYWASLESTVALYERMMSAWLAHAAASPIPVHTLRYEDLVADMPERMRLLLEFLGLPWDDGVLDYSSKARQRGRISTPSYAQVVEPIYNQAIGRWQRYETYLRPHLPRLAPFVERFGYQPEIATDAGRSAS